MKFSELVFELDLPQNVFHAQTHIKKNQIVFRTSKTYKSVKATSLNSLRIKHFLLIIRKEIKTIYRRPVMNYVHINDINIMFN